MEPRIEATRSLPLRHRLTRLIALCSGLTALLCMLAVVGTGWWLQEGRAREENTEVARTLSYALQAAVAFEDQRGMADALGILRARPQISGAWVYDAGGRRLAAYGSGTPVPPGAQGGSLWMGRLTASEPVVVDGRSVGTVTIVGQLSQLWKSLLTALVAMSSIRRGNIARHRRWMTRAYLVTLAPVVFRLLLPAWIASGRVPSPDAIALLLWSSWVLPLLLHGVLSNAWTRWWGRTPSMASPAG